MYFDSQLAIMVSMSISNLVQEARRRAGLTQAELARRAGVPKSTVARIESRARTSLDPDGGAPRSRCGSFRCRSPSGEPDPGTDAMFERTLRRSPKERLTDATRAARFVLRGRP